MLKRVKKDYNQNAKVILERTCPFLKFYVVVRLNVSEIVTTKLIKCKNVKKELTDYFPQGRYFDKIVILQPK